jgi:hypothetical protein
MRKIIYAHIPITPQDAMFPEKAKPVSVDGI